MTADSSGTTSERQARVILYLAQRAYVGATWREIADEFGWHHGTASGALSVLHMDGKISRLAQRRDRCKVYVEPLWVMGRETEPHGRKARPCPNCGVTA